ncbi:serine hydrolase [Ochrobactrum sp. BD67]
MLKMVAPALALFVGMGTFLAGTTTLPIAPAAAQTRETHPVVKLQSLFDTKSIDPDWFAPAFLEQVSASQVEQIITQMKSAFGAPSAINISENKGFVNFENARVPVRIVLDQQGKIETLWFGPPQSENRSLEGLLQDINSAGTGDISVLVMIDGKRVLDQGSDRPMAVGSAFKLVVLEAYEDAVQAGTVKRDQVAILGEHDRSLPSGTLQELPAGTPVTVELLAQLMIRISDNTATDILIRLLGRDKLEALSPRNTPFLNTREFFQLIASGAEQIRDQYKAASRQERLQLLDDLSSKPLPPIAEIGHSITWRDVEWHLTASEICDLLRSLKDAPSLTRSTNPLFTELGWPQIGFKGGSETGVLNLSVIGTTSKGKEVCAVYIANGDQSLPEDRIAALFADILRLAETVDAAGPD